MARRELRALGSVGYLDKEPGTTTYSAVLKDLIDGRLWLLVAHCLPSGLDLQNIGLVVHYGKPKSLSMYHGEIGHLARYHYFAEDIDAKPSVYAATSLIIAVPPPLSHPDEHLEGAVASNMQPIQHNKELVMGVVLRCAAQGDCNRRQLSRHWGLATFKGCAESGGYECSSCCPIDDLGPDYYLNFNQSHFYLCTL